MEDSARDHISRILENIASGEERVSELMPVLYAELRAMAVQFMRTERDDHTLQPTALVNEMFLRLAGGVGAPTARGEFLAAAANTMRRVLVDHARRTKADKRGGEWRRVTFSGIEPGAGKQDFDVLALHESLSRLEQLDRRQAQIVELRFFAGMTGQEIADHVGVSRKTVVNDLTMARAWLRVELERS